MSILKTIGTKLGIIAKPVETFALNELDKGIAAAKEPLRPVLLAAIGAAEAAAADQGSTFDKLAHAVEAVAPAVVSYLAKNGVKVVVANVEQFTKILIESTLADMKVTKAVTIARAFLALFK